MERTERGYEAMNIVRDGKLQGVKTGDINGQVAFIDDLFGVVTQADQEVGIHAYPIPSDFCNTALRTYYASLKSTATSKAQLSSHFREDYPE